MDIRMLATHTCTRCKMAAKYMDEHDIPFKEIFAEDPDGRELAVSSGITQVPVLFVTGDDGSEKMIRDTGAGEVMSFIKAL